MVKPFESFRDRMLVAEQKQRINDESDAWWAKNAKSDRPPLQTKSKAIRFVLRLGETLGLRYISTD